jgi:hypothetical protein
LFEVLLDFGDQNHHWFAVKWVYLSQLCIERPYLLQYLLSVENYKKVIFMEEM